MNPSMTNTQTSEERVREMPHYELFDEQALLQEIYRIWGQYGAHADVMQMLLAASAAREEQIKRLREALRYWLPKSEPFPDQHDPICKAHREAWHAARAALKETEE